VSQISPQEAVSGERSESAFPDHLRLEIERYLETLSFTADPTIEGLQEAMRYSLLAGGKRIRPVLALATA
jgi:geranylgeranyl diphosphate synthase type II